MRLRPLNEVAKEYAEFSADYLIGDDGFIYKRLKCGYYRDPKYGYQQTRNTFGTSKQHTVKNSIATAKAYVPNPDNLSDVDHINNDKTDNRADNLQWLSHRDNLRKKSKDKIKGEQL